MLRELGIDEELEKLSNEVEEEIKELLENGFSSKGWESKCLLGRKAKDKNLEDEQTILNYFDDVIKPNMVKNLKYSYDKSKV